MSSTHVSTAEAPDIGSLDDKHRARLQARALDAWREAEWQVHGRWDAFLVADRGARRAAFAAYVAALDAEAAAAVALARAHIDPAAGA